MTKIVHLNECEPDQHQNWVKTQYSSVVETAELCEQTQYMASELFPHETVWIEDADRVPAGAARGDWMQTYTGRAFYPLDPRPDDIDPVDIAHALGMLCRFGGHSQEFYSVAEHCVLMSHAVAPEYALWALLHDASEAYVADLVRPLKYALPDYRSIEDRVMAAVCARFALTGPCPPAVKAADLSILHDERDALLGSAPLPWESIEQVPPLGVKIYCWSPADAGGFYQDRLGELMLARTHTG